MKEYNITIRFSVEQKDKLAFLAKKLKCSKAEVVRQAVDVYKTGGN